ncbi:MAG: recombinase family protein, partial [Rhodocyclaceae bacterium]|nr:recombinase family protein [Rhodocyclaceae bacterium]
MIKAVLYLRSSKDRADVSIDAQRRALQELAQARGFAIVGEYADAVESGKDDDRPGFQSLIADLRAAGRTWDHILALDTARIARRRALAIIFEEHECKRRGVKVVYRSLPEADPITEMLLKSILQAMDEWHSLTSKVKGLSGMAENVRQGWRAGGRAPRGYVLQAVETGAIRDGAPVTKTKLATGPDAPAMRTYLKARAIGIERARAARAAGLDISTTSLIDIERNALTYAGHTVWNRHAERDGGGYVGGSKLRPRSEWIVQRNTHEALITDDEAEAILAAVSANKRKAGKKGSRVYLLSGILVAPDGAMWHGESGFYRIKRGPRISAEAVERGIVQRVIERFTSDEMATEIAAHYRRLAEQAKDAGRDTAAQRRKIGDLEKRIARLANLLSETATPAALLRQIEVLEAERSEMIATLENHESDASMARALRNVSADDVKRLLAGIADDLNAASPESLRDTLRQVIDRVVLDPVTFDASITYRIEPAVKAGSSWRPHGDSRMTPVFVAIDHVQILSLIHI